MKSYKVKDLCSLRVNPIKSGVRDFNSLLEFYLYTAPLIDSALSYGDIDESDQEDIIFKIKKEIGTKNIEFIKRINNNSFEKRALSGDNIDFSKQTVLCHRMSKETELHSLLRHIRNSIAHGNVFICNKKYVCFDDYDSESRKRRHTARIIVSIERLKIWKSLILKER